MNPRVSIITPFLNAEGDLAEAIASVRAQICTDWELLLVDDGSNDGSAAIAAHAAQEDPRIRLLHRAPDKPGGAAAARNLGLKAARGDFIAFLDADDVYMADKLASQLALMERYPAAMMVYGPTRWWYPEDERRDWTERMRSTAGRLHPAPRLLNRILLMQRGPVPCTCAVLIRRGVFDLVDGFEERFRLYEDQTLWVKIMLRFPVHVSNHVTALYRQHSGSVSAGSERDGEYDRLRPHPARHAFLDWIEEYVPASGIDDISVKRALRRARAILSGDRSRLTLADRIVLSTYQAQGLARAVRRKFHRFTKRLLGQVSR